MKTHILPQARAGWRCRAGWLVAGSFLAYGVPAVSTRVWAGQEDAASGAASPKQEPAADAPAAEAPAAEAPAAEEEEAPSEYSNWIELSAGGVAVDGRTSSFQSRHGLPGDTGFGGVNAAHWEKFIGENGLLKIDGRALLEQEDYKVSVDYEVTDKGYVRAGYRQYRTWYDGVGGLYPGSDAWVPLSNRDLELDRGEAWFEGGLRLPSWPEIDFRYSHQFRDGKKDSLVWGQVNVPGGTRGVGASFWDMDETRDIFEGKVRHTVGKTDLGLGFRYEMSDVDNSLNLRQSPGAPLETYITQKDKVETDLSSAHAYTTTRLNERVMFSSGYAFTTLDTDLGGSRIYGAGYDPIYDPGLAIAPGFLSLSGGSQLDQHVVNFNSHVTPWDHVAIIPSVRLERIDVDGRSLYLETPTFSEQEGRSDRGYTDLAEGLEVRYSKWKNWVLYASGDWVQGDGDLEERQIARATGTTTLDRDTDFTRFTQKYAAGANWYPRRHLNLSGQYYHKIHENDYDHNRDSTSNDPASIFRYPAFIKDQDFETDDVNFRVTWRPVNQVTLVSRYDFQLSTVDTRAAGYSELETADMTSHIFSETLTWNPWAWIYFQAGLNYVLNELSTPANDNPAPSGLVLESENDYWQGTFTAGVALDKKTDLEATYFYSRADNYSDNSSDSQPYGAGFEEHGVTAGIVRRLRQGLLWSLKYGWFKSRDQATQGHTDYTAHLVYSSVIYRF